MRKTVNVDEVKDFVNMVLTKNDLYLKAPGKERDLTNDEAFRMGAISVLEHIQHKTGNYHGFLYLPEVMVHRAENPGERSVISDETKRTYLLPAHSHASRICDVWLRACKFKHGRETRKCQVVTSGVNTTNSQPTMTSCGIWKMTGMIH